MAKRLSFLLLVTLVFLPPTAFAKCNPRLCFEGEIEVTDCIEDKEITAAYAKRAEAAKYNTELRKIYTGTHEFIITGKMYEGRLCAGWEAVVAGVTPADVGAFLARPVTYTVASKDPALCSQKRILVTAKTGCCPNGANERRCEEPLLISELRHPPALP